MTALIMRVNSYYPDEVNVVENKPISASTSHIHNTNREEVTSDIQDFILSKRPENTLKNPNMT